MTETLPDHGPGQSPPPASAPSVLPDIPGPIQTLGILWRKLRRMSTALVLLFAMAAAAVVATFVPQEPATPSTVAQWRAGEAGPGADIARAFEALGLFDLFGSWWFMTLTALLFVSLTGCLVPRYAAFLRTVRRPPAAGRNLERLASRRALRTALPSDQALAAADRVLARRHFRRLRTADGRQLAAERGHWREGGSLAFHTAFYLLLTGAIIGQTFGFRGQINLPEGAVFADTRIAYDLAEPGRAFGLGDHRGFVVRLDDFAAEWHPNGVPRDFVSTVTVIEDGQEVRTAAVRVNHPLTHDGMKLYQARFGMAPRIVVRAGERVLYDEPVMLAETTNGLWTGVAKILVPSGDGPQLALDLVLLPDVSIDEQGRLVTASPEARAPLLLGDLWTGQLGLERNLPPREFLRADGEVAGEVSLAEGASQELLNGALTVEFAELRMWSGFQVSHAPGRMLLLASAILLLGGLIPSLYSYRRRIWVQATPGASGAQTHIAVAGAALQRKPRFAEEFTAIADELTKALGDSPPAASSARATRQDRVKE
ncbi:MAG TPA: cytochrome c biogenesis protein ResB [Egibacteraceae bacterium]|nr:cytochrome c biogenesis protein ResB [Egibacteraceae bacterium]